MNRRQSGLSGAAQRSGLVRFDERERETEPCQTGLQRRRESFVISDRETTATAPVLVSTLISLIDLGGVVSTRVC